jgi:prevent-host-death family protein
METGRSKTAMEVGVRELRDHLSRYLTRVRAGEEIVVTEHGRAVARLVGLDRERSLDRLIAEGRVTPSPRAGRKLPARRIVAKAPVSDLVADQRR